MIWVGTSGFQYPEWKGKFYPEKFSPKKMLAFYSERFNSTESNYTFRRIPCEKTLANWVAQTPARFRFSLKAPQEITHRRKLRDCEATLKRFAAVAQVLGPKLGAVLFQLAPSFKRDLPLLSDFLAAIPSSIKSAFEFRHRSWFEDPVFAALGENQCALCIADSEDLTTPATLTAPHAYFRLRNEGYRAAHLKHWAGEVRSLSRKATDTYVYFKHEERGTGPMFAQRLLELLRTRGRRNFRE